MRWCSWWWTGDSPKHVQPNNELINIIYKKCFISLVCLHIETWCTIHTTLNYFVSIYIRYFLIFPCDFSCLVGFHIYLLQMERQCFIEYLYRFVLSWKYNTDILTWLQGSIFCCLPLTVCSVGNFQIKYYLCFKYFDLEVNTLIFETSFLFKFVIFHIPFTFTKCSVVLLRK